MYPFDLLRSNPQKSPCRTLSSSRTFPTAPVIVPATMNRTTMRHPNIDAILASPRFRHIRLWSHTIRAPRFLYHGLSPRNANHSRSPDSPEKAKKVRMAGPCVTVPFHRPGRRRPVYTVPISLTKCLEKGDIVSLVFLNQVDKSRSWNVPPEWSDHCHKSLSVADVFSKKEAETLSPLHGATFLSKKVRADIRPVRARAQSPRGIY